MQHFLPGKRAEHRALVVSSKKGYSMHICNITRQNLKYIPRCVKMSPKKPVKMWRWANWKRLQQDLKQRPVLAAT